MKFALRPLISLLLAAKGFLLLAVPIAAWAAQTALQRVVRPEDLSAWTWFFLLLFSNGAWATASLDSLVSWVADVEPRTIAEWRALWKVRISQVIMPWLAANAAGILAYMLGKGVPSWFNLDTDPPEMVLLIAAFFAALGGHRTLERMRARFFPGVVQNPGQDQGQQP